jgi:hypothetical protein
VRKPSHALLSHEEERVWCEASTFEMRSVESLARACFQPTIFHIHRMACVLLLRTYTYCSF